MKLAISAAAFALMSLAGAIAAPAASAQPSIPSFTSSDSFKVFAANRTGSHRVGGSGRSGKGGHYVGGRKR